MNLERYPVIYEGSVKKVRQVTPATETRLGEAIFEFTDYSSVKDYGQLPFETSFKGEDLCTMAVESFRGIEQLGIKTLFRERVSKNAMMVASVQVLNPDHVDLSEIRSCRLIPLECIVRNLVTETSSARKRLGNGTLHPQAMGLEKMPESYPVILPRMFVEGSTKLRAVDEYLSWEELRNLCRESVEIFNRIDLYSRMIGTYALKKGSDCGLIINDFKLEWALDAKGELALADIPLAIDEITSAYVGRSFSSLDEFKDSIDIFVPGKNHNPNAFVNVSKQIFRDHYTAAHPDWVSALSAAQQKGSKPRDYPKPPAIPQKLNELAVGMFGGLRNLWAPAMLRDAPPMDKIVNEYKQWASNFYKLGEH